MMDDAALRNLMEVISKTDTIAALAVLAACPALAKAALIDGATRTTAQANFLPKIGHYVYAGDTALHLAAAAHQPDVVRALVDAGANVKARNRRGATPLHYAADGNPASVDWAPHRQAETIRLLIESGADPNSVDQSGVAPLHRAIRNRCAAATAALIEGGADVRAPNGRGSTPLLLATRQAGRSGSGSLEARAQQAEIIGLLQGQGLPA